MRRSMLVVLFVCMTLISRAAVITASGGDALQRAVKNELSGLAPSYGPLVPGESVSFSIPTLVGYSAKGLPSGLKLNSKTGEISGSPKKPTGDDGATVAFSKKGAETLTAKFVVGPIPTIDVTLVGDTEKCKVTGANKAYLVGKKVSLMAKAPKGTAFVGWFKDGEPWPSEAESGKAKLSYVMTAECLALVAKFEKEKMSLSCPGLAAGTFTVGVCGAGDGIPLEISTQSGVKSVKASKLPTGMKLVKDKSTGEWMITGAPTKAGAYNVVLTVMAVSGATESVTIPVTVESLPDWVVGTFEGYGYDQYFGDGYEWTTFPVGHWSGRVQCSISSAGKATTVLTSGQTRRGNAQLKCGRAGSYEFEIEGVNVSIVCREINGIKIGYMYAKWSHTNEWNEHIVTEAKGWQLRWQEFSQQGLVPKFAAKTETKLQMSELKYDYCPTEDPQLTLPGSLLLKYGKNGALMATYLPTQGGKASATASAQLVPFEMDANGRLRMETTIMIKLMQDRYFLLHLFLSTPVGSQFVYGDEVRVEDYLLTVEE